MLVHSDLEPNALGTVLMLLAYEVLSNDPTL